MTTATTHMRSRSNVPVVELPGHRDRRHLGALAGLGDRISSREAGFGALRVFDDITIDPASQIAIGAHDGFEILVQVLEGDCRITDDCAHAIELGRDGAAYLLLGQGIRHDVRNPSASAPLRVLVAAIVAPAANPPPRIAVGSFAHEAPGIVWLASHDAEQHEEGSLLLRSSGRIGLATLDRGAAHEFPKAVDRGLFLNVLEGYIQLDSDFLDAGGDARLSLDSPVRIEGVDRSRVVVIDVPMGFAQQLS